MLGKYYLHYLDETGDENWDQRANRNYYIEFISETLLLVSTVLHYIQILYLHGISLTLIDIVLLLHLRAAFGDLFKKIEGYRTFKVLQEHMNTK